MDYDCFDKRLDDLALRGLTRCFVAAEPVGKGRVRLGGRQAVCFGSNNYLGLAADPRVTGAAQEAIRRYGWGAGASRLISGTTPAHVRLEQELARFKGTESALVFGSGYQANQACIGALAQKGDLVLLDKLDHASIIDAARSCGAAVRTYPHRQTPEGGSLTKLNRLLEGAAKYRRRVIVTDSLFSMDGDLADLSELVRLKKRYDAILVIDEAHATGVLGANGRGVTELLGVEEEIDVTVGTLSKALGGIGGFVAAGRAFIDCLVNTARGFIYTTAPPAAAAAAAQAALDIVRAEPNRRKKVLALADQMRCGLKEKGFDTLKSCSQIIPIMVGESEEALSLSRRLLDAGFQVPAIRPPTVGPGAARLRLSLTADHTSDDVDSFISAL